MLLLHPRYVIACAAIHLLSVFFVSPPNADEGDKPTPPVGTAKPDGRFRTEDLTIPAGELQLAGTLYLPHLAKQVPAVVLVHGAGPTVRSDRYHALARHFAQKGVAALIYDKRGCGASTGDWTRAGMYDLAEDALACVRLLRRRPDIDPAQVGLWGLSQGASIIPIAASQTQDVAFVIAVGGCLDFEGQMRYFRANVFRRHRLPRAALDVANKTFLIQVDVSNRVRSGSLPAPRWLQESCRFEFDLDQTAVWRQVRQPILAIYGERDQQVPVAENSTPLARAVEQSGNQNFTLVIYPDASHAIGKTRSGKLGEEWTGYVPEYLEDMGDWVLQQAGGAKRPEGWPQRGRIAASDQPFTAARYDQLRWYGNVLVQALQVIVFAMVFFVGAVAGLVSLARRRRREQMPTVSSVRKWLTPVATVLSILNLALLTGLVALTAGLANQWKPSYPEALNWLPLLGSLSFCLTLTLLALFLAGWRALSESRRTRIGWGLFATCALAFVPFLHYWNLLGLDLR